VSFFLLGVLNNVPYVVMIAGAKSISEGGTGLVFLANIMPGLLIKLSSPYWFEKVSYGKRIMMGSILMAMSFCLVATFGYLKEISASSSSLASTNENVNNDNYANDDINNDTSDQGTGTDFYLAMQLIGVACCSAQGSLGEATLLALSGKVDSLIEEHQKGMSADSDSNPSPRETANEANNTPVYQTIREDFDGENDNGVTKRESKSLCITAFSSGTGLAGVLGFAYIEILTEVLGFSLTGALYIALLFPICYMAIYKKFLATYAKATLDKRNDEEEDEETMAMNVNDNTTSTSSQEELGSQVVNQIDREVETESLSLASNNEIVSCASENAEEEFSDNPTPIDSLEVSSNGERSVVSPANDNIIKGMSTFERLKLIISLWPYMIPLFVVYAAEYALQSGVWTAIGFPVNDIDARKTFYTKSNWLYQVGVFLSRSSGAFFTAPMWILWLMPILQCANLAFFYLVATYHFWYNDFLLILCLYSGLLGGSVYVNGYMRVNKDLPISIREFALSTVSIADSVGIVFADFSGLFIQSCLYRSNGLSGSVVSCPI
jgi:battenin